MSYFDDASLVFIPSGTKVSKAYSVKPIDGSGDLTFTRSNDTATRVASNGLIEKVRTNLVLQSVWPNIGTGVAPTSWSASFLNFSAGPLAGQLLCNTSASRGFITQSVSLTAGQYALSVFVDTVTISNPVLSLITIFGSTNVKFYEDGIEVDSSTSIVAGKRYTTVGTVTTGSFTLRVGSGVTTNATANYVISRPQLESSDFGATPYIATTTAAVSVGPVANLPRIDYTGGGCGKLLLEPQRTNLITFSEQFTNAAWLKTNVSVTANSIISPDGSMNADTLAGNGSAGIHIIQQIISAYGANDTISIFAKKGTNNFIQIYTDFVNTDYANFNLNTGVVGDKGATTGATTITDYGNGWYRCTMVTGSALSGNVNIALISSATSARAETNSLSTNLYIYGCGLESGDYATSYIPTLGAAVTRGVDLAVDTAASSLIGQTEGTIYAEVNFDSNVNTEGYIVRLDDTSFNDTVVLSRGNDKRLNSILRAGGSTIVNIQQDNFNGLKRVAFAYKSGSFAVYVDGVQVGTSAATYTNGITYGEVRIGGFDASTANMSGGISKVLLFKTRLTNAQLAELTTI